MTERHGLYVSAAGNLFMTVLGLFFALWAGSDAIMFDAFFSGVQLVMVGVNIFIAGLLVRRATTSFQFGYAAFEPLVITLRGALILGGAGYAFWMAVRAMLSGGRELSMGLGVLYAVLAAGGCLVLGFVIDRIQRHVHSPILQADAQAWLMDAGLSAGVAGAFLIGYLIQGTRFAHLLPYLDPALVIVMVLALIAIPLRTLGEGLRGLLGAAPEADLQQTLSDRAEEVLRTFGLSQVRLRMAQPGRMLYILGHVLVPADREISGIADLDTVRNTLEEALRTTAADFGVPNLEVDTVFTSHPKWMEL